ncbi:flotillin family protein [Paraneptunicella aestuarii]|uniref:flotillin family protein n=1 Tax=Paraneptunicella aestuarii TaxID=2831148 RepID=UPI001E3827BB|nr:flotillin domain-containing protein [Paraneptunicella aestuarii]UAA39575.1 flotillin family protein [Paraneptunicella aestuarii]
METAANTNFDLIFMAVIAGIVLIVLLTTGLMLAKLFKRSTKEYSFVRTGFGGEKVVMNGGAIVLPVLHDMVYVKMSTLRIEVERSKEEALISADRLRVDVKADFYIRVQPTIDGISKAATTLGNRTQNPEEVKMLMESKFVDVLRAVAAEMTMQEMHEQRPEFVQKVQVAIVNDLQKNGLELESVSLTSFDQTNVEYFNPNNAFDAEGLANVTKITEAKKKETNDIQQHNRIAIETRNFEAEQESLLIKQRQEEARLAQEKAVALATAEQKAQIAAQRADKEREEREAEIRKEQNIEAAEIAKQLAIQQQRIQQQKAAEEQEIARMRDIEVARQDQKIIIAKKSEEESAARAQAAEAEKTRVAKEEEVITTQKLAEAERERLIATTKAKQEAEEEAVTITVQAEAGRKAAEDKAESVRIEAQAQADAARLRAQADKVVYEVEAEGKRAINEAENAVRDEVLELKRALEMIRILPELVAQTVKPFEKISDIKVLHGYGAAGVSGNGQSDSGSSKGLADDITSAALAYRANAPLVDNMLKELGIVGDNGSLDDLVQGRVSVPSSLAGAQDKVKEHLDEVVSVPECSEKTTVMTEKE